MMIIFFFGALNGVEGGKRRGKFLRVHSSLSIVSRGSIMGKLLVLVLSCGVLCVLGQSLCDDFPCCQMEVFFYFLNCFCVLLLDSPNHLFSLPRLSD